MPTESSGWWTALPRETSIDTCIRAYERQNSGRNRSQWHERKKSLVSSSQFSLKCCAVFSFSCLSVDFSFSGTADTGCVSFNDALLADMLMSLFIRSGNRWLDEKGTVIGPCWVSAHVGKHRKPTHFCIHMNWLSLFVHHPACDFFCLLGVLKK